MGCAYPPPRPAPIRRTVTLSAHARAVIVEALAAALVEDYRDIRQTPGDSPTGHARHTPESVRRTRGGWAVGGAT